MKKSTLTLILAAFLSSHLALAKNIDMFDQPKNDAKVVGKIDSEAGIIPIFTPKDNTAWIKVADPRNGNVGWIKSSELDGKGATNVTFTQRVVNTGSKPQNYQQFISFGTPQLTPDQTQALYKQMQDRQKAIQDDMQKIMNDVYKDTAAAWANFPVVVPVVMVPVASEAPVKSPATTAKPAAKNANK